LTEEGIFDTLRQKRFVMTSKSYLATVLRNRNFLALWIGQVISQFGDRLAQMGLVGIYLRETEGISVAHSVPTIRNLFFFSTLPLLIFSPIAGVYVDRWKRKNMLILTDFVRAGLILLIPFFRLYTQKMSYIYIVIFLLFTVTCFFTPAKSAFIPDLVNKEELLAANSLSNITRILAMIGGVTAGGLIVTRLGTTPSFMLDSVSFGASGLAIFFIRVKENPGIKNPDSGLLKKMGKEVLQGLLFIRREKAIFFLAVTLVVLMGASGLAYVLVTVLITKELGLGAVGLGIIASTLGIGMIGGSLVYGQFGGKFPKDLVILGSTMAAGISTLVLGGSESIHWLGTGVFLIGFVAAIIMVAAHTLTQEITPDRLRGRVFSGLEIIINSSFLLSVWIAGTLGSRYPLSLIFYGIGGSLVLYSGLLFLFRIGERGAKGASLHLI